LPLPNTVNRAPVLQVMETPHEMTFLSVLQYLLQIDASDVLGDVIWETVSKLIAGASTLGGRADAERLLADGMRRLNRAVAASPRRRSARCSNTCPCVCHEDFSRNDSTSSAMMSPIICRPSTDTGIVAQRFFILVFLLI